MLVIGMGIVMVAFSVAILAWAFPRIPRRF